ncbi:Fic family protein [Nitrobacter sp. TKz-YC02]|uniref:Fic family protein n=1 Tax=Nitrobacter sp. TKz-YC02 TaxID=3398704 RepID=UPI003CF99A6E
MGGRDGEGAEPLSAVLLVIVVFVVVFLEIHPFQGGNGRVSRVLTTLLLLAAMSELSVILEVAREHGRVTVAETARVSGASRNTVKVHFKSLVICN